MRQAGAAVTALGLSVGVAAALPAPASAELRTASTSLTSQSALRGAALPGAALPGAALPATPAANGVGAVENPAAAAIGYAFAMLGKPYVWGGQTPGIGFDCSGLTMRSYLAAGVKLPRTAAQQYQALPHLPIADVQPGDLVFKATDLTDSSSIYHVTMYVGGGMVVAAPYTGTVVQVEPMDTHNVVPFVVRPAAGQGVATVPAALPAPAPVTAPVTAPVIALAPAPVPAPVHAAAPAPAPAPAPAAAVDSGTAATGDGGTVDATAILAGTAKPPTRVVALDVAARPVSVPAPAATPEAAPAPAPAPAATGLLPIVAGTSGWNVTDLQHRLRANGFAVTVTGVFDAATQDAVHRLRARLGFPDDDYVGDLTWNWLVSHGNQTSVS